MNTAKSSLRAYKMNVAMYVTEDDNVDDVVLPANHCVLTKIGYDEDKKPLYTMRISDGCRKISEIGYVVPVGTEPAYALGSSEVEAPTCGNCVPKGSTYNGEVVEQETCTCGADMCWCQ